jgi:glycyl-tRNA synthetase
MVHTQEEFASYLKKKGFIYKSSLIYGGLSGFYDYGHLGTSLKKNFENLWREYFLNLNDNFHEIESCQIMHENVFKASGHLENFTDPVAITKTGCFERADHLLERELGGRYEGLSIDEMKNLIDEKSIKGPDGSEIVEVKHVNMMFPVELGVGDKNKAYLRPETAQSPFVNFKLQHEILRKKMPLGLALIGRAFRNEISPRNLTLRQRAFTQAELQIFFNPDNLDSHPDFNRVMDVPLRVMLVKDREANIVVERSANDLVKLGLPKFYVYHMVRIQEFYLDVLKISKDKFRLYELNDKEKAFYNKFHFDLEVDLSSHGWTEMGGLHYRTDHDLRGHQEVSKENMLVFDEATQKKYVPHVLELSFGVDRNVFSLLDLGYAKADTRGHDVMDLPQGLAVYDFAVFPLMKNKAQLFDLAREIYLGLKKKHGCYFDAGGAVGRRYARADEIGVRACVTIDFESLEDGCVTVRDLITTEQKRVKIKDLV